MSELQPSFQGALWFKRWSDSSTQGVQVTFALADADELEPLKTKIGKRFACVLVEIGDDEQPVPAIAMPRPKDARGPYCREACDLCKTKDFRAWIAAEEGVVGDPDTMTDDEARDWLLARCGGISSRKELDTDAIASELFITRVRVPFMKWQRAQDRATT